MLEHTQKPPIDGPLVVLSVLCRQSILAEVKAVLADKGCAVHEDMKPAAARGEKEWYTVDEVFPDFHAGHSIRGLRYRECLTQKQLAKQINISVHNLSNMEHGRRPVGKEMAKRLAHALNTDWRLLLS